MRLNKEDYQKAVGILKRYNYNCLNILLINNDIVSIGAANYDGQPHAKNNIVDITLNKVIQFEENKELKKSMYEYKIVEKVKRLISADAKYIFEQIYVQSKSKWDVIESGMSERTFGRRKNELIYAVDRELKKDN